MNIEDMKKARMALNSFVKKVSPFAGKHWNKQSHETRAMIEDLYACCVGTNAGGFQYKDCSANMNAPTITTENAEKLLKSVEEDIHLYDTLSTDPMIEEWKVLIDKLASLSKEFTDKGMRSAPFDAKRLGLVRGTVNW